MLMIFMPEKGKLVMQVLHGITILIWSAKISQLDT